MRAAHNDTELAANYLLSANIFHSQSTCQNTAVPAPSAAAAAGASYTESEKIAEQVGICTAARVALERVPCNRWRAVRRKALWHRLNGCSC